MSGLSIGNLLSTTGLTPSGSLSTGAGLYFAGIGPLVNYNYTALPSLPVDHTFTVAAGTRTYFDSTGILQTNSTANSPRLLSYDPAALTRNGLVLEDAATNLFLQSGLGANAAWALLSASAVASSGIGVQGGNTLALLTTTVAGTQSAHYQGPLIVSINSTVTHSRILKAGTNTQPYISIYDNDHHQAQFSLSGAGSVLSADAGVTAGIKAVSNGEYMVWVTYTITGVAAFGLLFVSGSKAGGSVLNETVYHDVGQVEVGAAPTSYIPTTTTSVARPAETLALTGSPLAIMQGAAWSGVAETQNVGNTSGVILGFQSTAVGYPLSLNASTTQGASYNGAATITSTLGAGTFTDTKRFGFAVDATGRSFVVTGGTTATDAGVKSTGSVTAATLMSINGAQYGNGNIRSFALWNSRITDARLKQNVDTPGGSYQ